MKLNVTLFLIAILISESIYTQAIDVNHVTYPLAKNSLAVLKEILAIPNDANFPEDIEKNVNWCIEKIVPFGFKTVRLETPSVPLLLCEQINHNEALPTLLYYFHIDGQPVDAKFWFQDDPYQAVLKNQVEGEGWVDLDWNNLLEDQLDSDWRIFARSSSDDKSPFIMFLTALETLKSQSQKLSYNLKIILDFEEEKGSPNLAQAVRENKDKLSADALIIFDGPKHPNNEPTISYGARGITTMSIKIFGPTYPLHSGHYGNYAPNPALRLSKLLATMKDDQGRVIIPGYYDGIEINDETQAILKSVPDNENELKVKLGIGETDQVGNTYQEALQYPSLNIRGMSSAWVGSESRTIVPATALAELDLRLVVESDGDRLKKLVRRHIEDQGYYIIKEKPTSRERITYPKICQISSRGGDQGI